MKIVSFSENIDLEKRVAITPEIIKKYISIGLEVSLPTKYATHLGFSDEEYKSLGANIVKDENSWTRVGWNPFRGKELTGWTVLTIVDGIPVFERSPVSGQKGRLLVDKGAVGKPLLMGPWK